MAITRNIVALILVVSAIIALAIGVTIARAIINHGAAAVSTSVSAPFTTPDVGYHF